jgi:cobalt-zinc-cadmium efflux system outer membrane protein
VLTLADALTRVLATSPELASVASEERAREAHALQAGLLPNPEFRTDLENVAGSGDREGFEETETTIRLSQLIELGGKRGKRRRVAELDRALAGWDVEAKRLAVLADATKAFVRTLAAQERLDLAVELERVARTGVDAVQAQIEAGGAPPVEAARARVTQARTDVARRRAERELDAARRLLAATWGSFEPTFGRVAGDLERLGALPSFEALVARLDANPDLARWTTELQARRSSIALEEAGRIPDVTVGAGGRHFSDNGDNALVVELSVPLPVFNRNQGNIAEANLRMEKARADRDVAGLELRTTLVTAYAELAASHEQATRLRADVIPAARRSLDGVVDAHRKGAMRFIDVLDAQRTLYELRGDYLAALESFHVQAANVERLTASPLGNGGAR